MPDAKNAPSLELEERTILQEAGPRSTARRTIAGRLEAAGFKYCTACRSVLPLDLFGAKSAQCSPCRNKAAAKRRAKRDRTETYEQRETRLERERESKRAWAAANPEKVKAQRERSQFYATIRRRLAEAAKYRQMIREAEAAKAKVAEWEVQGLGPYDAHPGEPPMPRSSDYPSNEAWVDAIMKYERDHPAVKAAMTERGQIAIRANDYGCPYRGKVKRYLSKEERRERGGVPDVVAFPWEHLAACIAQLAKYTSEQIEEAKRRASDGNERFDPVLERMVRRMMRDFDRRQRQMSPEERSLRTERVSLWFDYFVYVVDSDEFADHVEEQKFEEVRARERRLLYGSSAVTEVAFEESGLRLSTGMMDTVQVERLTRMKEIDKRLAEIAAEREAQS